jgi:hypothetical protein
MTAIRWVPRYHRSLSFDNMENNSALAPVPANVVGILRTQAIVSSVRVLLCTQSGMCAYVEARLVLNSWHP